MKRLLFHRQEPVEESPCGIAFDEENNEVVIAEYAADGGFEFRRVPADETRAVNVTTSDVRTCVLGWNAHTSRAQLPVAGEEADDKILRSIIEAVEADAQASAFNFTYSRTPDRLITLTQAETGDIADTLTRANAWLEMQRPTHIKQDLPAHIRLETRTRCNMRLWLSGANGHIDQSPVAFLTVGGAGYAIGLWTPRCGYIYETEERFERGANSEMIITHTRDVLIKFIAPSSLAQLELDLVSRVVVSAVPSLEERLIKVLRKSPELRSVQIEGIRLNHEEERSPEVDHLDYAMALALGALVETDSLYSIDAIDLSITPQEQLEQISQSHQIIEAAQEEKKARKARLAMAAPLVVVAAFLLTTWFQYRVEGASLLSKIDSEHETAGQLRQVTTDYESSRKNFGMFKILLDNLISLRERQPATHQLLRDLNSRWPKDASWSISEIDVKGGNVEIKGRTRNEQAITAFAKALEFSDGLFSNILTSNNVAGTSLTGTTASTTAAPQSSGVFEFTVRANYSPLKTPGQAPTAAIQAPAVSTPSVPAATSQTQTALPQNLILPPALATPANSQQVAGR